MRFAAALIIVVGALAALPAAAQPSPDSGPCASDKGDAGRCEIRRPSVAIDAAPAAPHAGATVTLTASGIGRGLRFDWDLDGDGEFDDATGAQVRHAFATTTTIAVRATDEEGRTASETRPLAVGATDLAPSGDLFAIPPSPRVGGDVHVIAQGSDPDGAIAKVEVDADGDGTYEAGGQDTLVHFASAGARTIRARFTDDGGNATTVTVPIDVHVANLPPTATLDLQPASPTVGQKVTLTTMASDRDGTVEHYAYDLDGDGTFETDGSAFGTETTYASAGLRDVGVRVTDDAGATAVARASIAVRDGDEPPAVTLERTASARTLFAAGGDADGGVGIFDWDLDGDGAYDDASGFIDNYVAIPGTGTGTFDVGVRVADLEGATSVARRAVSIHDLPATVPAITVTPAQPRVGQTVTFDAATLSDDLTSVVWDLDGDGTFGTSVSDTWLHQITTYATAGPRTVQVKVSDRQHRTATARVEVDVSPAAGNLVPGAAFSASTDWPRTGSPVTFTDTSTDADGTIAARAWDLDGDGAFDDGTGATVTRGFAAAGDHDVALRVTDDQGATTVQRRTLQVHDDDLPPRAVISSTAGDGTLVLRAGETSTLHGAAAAGSDDAVTLGWDADDDGAFDDGTAATLPVSFATTGFHRVRLHVRDAAGVEDTATLLVDVRPAGTEHAPALSLVLPQGIVRPGVTASFSAFTQDAEEDPVSIAWDLDGDGVFGDATGSDVQHVYATPGTYTVRVLASDAHGGSRRVTRTLNVVADAGLAPVTPTLSLPAVIHAGRPVTFGAWAFDPDVSDGAVGLRGVSLAFDLDGDGDFDDVPAADPTQPVATYTWTFPTAAPVTVAVRATDATNRSSVSTMTVHPTAANQPPVVAIGVHDAIVAGVAARLFAQASDPDGDANTSPALAWDADGDGDYDDGAGPVVAHTFATPGTYTVGLRATDADGASSVVRQTFSVGGTPPVASFDVSDAAPVIGESVTLSSTAADALASRSWDLDDDGAFDDASGATATVSYPDAGDRIVGLKVIDAAGDGAIRYVRLTVTSPAPAATATPVPTPVATPAPIARTLPKARPALAVSVKAPRLATLLKRGLAVTVRCSTGCRSTVVLKRGGKQLGRASGRGVVRVRLTAKARKALAHARSAKLTLTVAAGGATTVKKTVTVRR